MARPTLAQRLALLADIAGGIRAFARAVGKTPGAVSGWLDGAEPYATTLRQIAERTEVSEHWLRTGEGHEETELGNLRRLLEREGPRKRPVMGGLRADPSEYATRTTAGITLKRVPVISMAQAGLATVAWEDVEDYDTVEVFAVRDPRAIAIRIRGDSMLPDYREGTIAVLYPSEPVRSENLVIAKLADGSVLFKRLHIADGKWHFLSTNPKYAPIVVTPEDIQRVYTVAFTLKNELQ